MEISVIIEIVTVLVTLFLGRLSKKYFFIKSNLIPVQNLIIGCISFILYYIMTKDIHTSLIFSGLLAGGTYDLLKNLKEIKGSEENDL